MEGKSGVYSYSNCLRTKIFDQKGGLLIRSTKLCRTANRFPLSISIVSHGGRQVQCEHTRVLKGELMHNDAFTPTREDRITEYDISSILMNFVVFLFWRQGETQRMRTRIHIFKESLRLFLHLQKFLKIATTSSRIL